MTTYNHAFTLGFSVAGSIKEDASDITKEQFLEAIRRRIRDLENGNDIFEAVLPPYDTFEEGK